MFRCVFLARCFVEREKRKRERVDGVVFSLAPPPPVQKKKSLVFSLLLFTFLVLFSTLSLQEGTSSSFSLSLYSESMEPSPCVPLATALASATPLLGVAALLNDDANSSSLVVAVTAAGGGVSIVDGRSQVRFGWFSFFNLCMRG